MIVTTIPLDPGQKGYKKSLVEKLSRAAREHLAESKDAELFVLINRLRDWKLPLSPEGVGAHVAASPRRTRRRRFS